MAVPNAVISACWARAGARRAISIAISWCGIICVTNATSTAAGDAAAARVVAVVPRSGSWPPWPPSEEPQPVVASAALIASAIAPVRVF